ncbi:hypothetical protein KDN34_16970 [Shewanella yunxiaonensis]|uniref:Uncharacterized protein n=1 Tax=Shewanella yunxiaonensis TaxID=2829809 RepID=A0ABX7YU26_9GAMM|nr:hypothetical protein [Shewanella yunxiaonensis]QUN05839.1 hypothetical protein KDN34_16970 [Shewanella yunxiaonensis]
MFRPAIVLSVIFAFSTMPAAGATKLNNQTKLPENRAVGADGKPLSIPEHFQAALEYHASEAVTPVLNISDSQTSSKQPRSKQRAIANDASCRWLASRMADLNSRLQKGSHIDSYLQAELNDYRRQWSCLKCDSGGPSSADLSRCRP